LRKAAILVAAIAGGSLLALATAAQAQPPAPKNKDPNAPIVPDSQFEKSLPPLDPEIGKPLPPIQGIDAPGAAPVPAPGSKPSAAPQAAAAPVQDPALTQPLPPLSSFDVTTPPPSTGSAPAAAKAPAVRYTLSVEGLDEVGLAGRFRELSALKGGEAPNGAVIAQRAHEDETLAVRLLRSEGYYDGTATSAIVQEPVQEGQPARLRVTITTVPGKRYKLGEIKIAGPDTVPSGLARKELKVVSGAPIVAADVEAAEANVRLRLPQQGYPFTQVGMRDIILDPDTLLGDYTLPVETGPRSTFSGFTTEGNLAFDAHHVGTLARFRRGELYDSRKVDDLREAMRATNLFRTVSAEPVDTGQKAPDGTEYVNILVKQNKGPARSLTGSAGYNTGEGVKLEGAWEHRNLFPPEGAFRVQGVAGTNEQSLLVRFRRNNAGQRDRALLLQAEAGRRAYKAFKGYTTRLQGLVTRESTPIWQKRWTYAYGAELIATNEVRFGQPKLNLRDSYYIAGLIGQLGYDRSNSLLDPTKGFRLLARVNPEGSLRQGQRSPYVRNMFDASAYYPVSDKLTIAGRVRVGSIYGSSLADIAPSRRLYSGGGGSVRGFGFQELGPRDAQGIPTGGRSLNEFAIEGRYRFGNYGVVPFIDAGQVYDSQYPKFSNLRFGVGIGGRVYTNFGPMRVDVATPIARKKGESRIAVYVSIGQAF
jgi:translocation and assembly module TamA